MEHKIAPTSNCNMYSLEVRSTNAWLICSIHLHTYTHTCTHSHTHTHSCTHTCATHAHTHTYTHAHTHTHMHTHIHTHAHSCTHTCTCVITCAQTSARSMECRPACSYCACGITSTSCLCGNSVLLLEYRQLE